MKSNEALRKLKKAGWYIDHATGSHYILRHATRVDKISFPCHSSKEMATGTLKAIFKQAGI